MNDLSLFETVTSCRIIIEGVGTDHLDILGRFCEEVSSKIA